MAAHRPGTCAVLCLLLAASATALYVPGAYPVEWTSGSVLHPAVGALTSFDTELPFDYYTLPFCKPQGGVKRIANSANPGTILLGQRMETSAYNFTMKVQQLAQVVCEPPGYFGPVTSAEVKLLQSMIDKHYRVNLILDNLPVTVYDLLNEDQEYVRPGFELGYVEDGKYYINNHLVFNVLVYQTHGEYTEASRQYQNLMAGQTVDGRRSLKASTGSSQQQLREGQKQASKGAQIHSVMGSRRLKQAEPGTADTTEGQPYFMVVGFEVSPCSIQRDPSKAPEIVVCGDDAEHISPQEIKPGAKIMYTYDVHWQDSKIKWASRWDAYLRMPGGKVHWFSIMNSCLVVVVMASIVALILVRTVRRDLQQYEKLVLDSSSVADKDEAGWKLVSGDVFRAPANSKSLAVQVGSGVQIITTGTVTLVLATLGFLSPAARGALLSTSMVLYVWLALLAGFSAVYVWGSMERTYAGWPSVCWRVSLYFPGIVMAIFTVLNISIHSTGSTGAVPVLMYFGIVAVWFVVSVPLTFVGGYMALRAPIRENPVKTNQIPRHVPPPALTSHPVLLFFAAGVLPFGTIFIELYFAMTSIWLGYFYYLFGFVLLIGFLTLVVTAEIAVLCTYVQLCSEDYQWWWASFRRGGSVALYIAVYALGFLASSLTSLTGALSIFIYLCYMTIFTLGLYFAMGTVGLLASWLFVHAIFRAVKAD